MRVERRPRLTHSLRRCNCRALCLCRQRLNPAAESRREPVNDAPGDLLPPEPFVRGADGSFLAGKRRRPAQAPSLTTSPPRFFSRRVSRVAKRFADFRVRGRAVATTLRSFASDE